MRRLRLVRECLGGQTVTLGKESWERGKESRVVVIGLADQLAKDCWIKRPAEENPTRTVANQKTLERFLVSATWARPCTEED